MALDIYPIVLYQHTFGAQTGTLFVARDRACVQADFTARANNPVPWQRGVVRQLAQRAPNPAGRAAKAGKLSQLPITDHFAFWHLMKG